MYILYITYKIILCNIMYNIQNIYKMYARTRLHIYVYICDNVRFNINKNE